MIGVILGGLLDESFRRALLISGGDLGVFVSRPASAILLAANVVLILSQTPLARLVRRRPVEAR